MSWWYPSPERFDVTYDDEGRAYVTMEGRRFGVQRSHLNVDWSLESVYDYLYRGSRILGYVNGFTEAVMTFLLSTGIVFYTIMSVLFSLYLFNRMWDELADRLFGSITKRSETLAMFLFVFGLPTLSVVLVLSWPVVLYRQIRKELADSYIQDIDHRI